MLVSIIYVNWNCTNEILRSVRSVHQWTRSLGYEIVVVDNASEEDITGLKRDDVTLIQNPTNVGFGAGCNTAVKHSKGDYLLFLNPDTLLLSDVVGCLAEFLVHRPEAGCVGPMILEENGSIHFGAARSFPSLFNEFLEHSALAFRFPRSTLTGRPYYSYWDHNTTRQVNSLLGACMMLPRRIFEALGGFDESFFLYYEEVDLCRRVFQNGWQVWYVHRCRIMHEGQKSVKKKYGGMGPMLPIFLESAEKYFNKHHGRMYASLWRWMIVATHFTKYLLFRKPLNLFFFKWGLGIV
jgi:hypothetical protein